MPCLATEVAKASSNILGSGAFSRVGQSWAQRATSNRRPLGSRLAVLRQYAFASTCDAGIDSTTEKSGSFARRANSINATARLLLPFRLVNEIAIDTGTSAQAAAGDFWLGELGASSTALTGEYIRTINRKDIIIWPNRGILLPAPSIPIVFHSPPALHNYVTT